MKGLLKGLVLVVGCAAVVGGVVGFAQPEKPKSGHPAKGDHPAAGQPEGMPDMAAMMEKMKTAATPGKMHEFLCSAAGTWEGRTTAWMDPAQPPSTSTCTTKITPILGGRFVTIETKGSFIDPTTGQPTPFEGYGIAGYNNTTGKFESSWCDNFGTMILNMTGELGDGGKTITWTGHYFCPVMEKNTWMREVEKRTGSNTMTLEFYSPTPDGKGEFKMMQIDYTKKN
jgi:hypothetical protein